MSSTGSACCKGASGGGPHNCAKDEDGSTCTFRVMCTLQTQEGEFPCECICTCRCLNGDCKKCVCKCDCIPEKAQKIQNSDGTFKYQCECTCSC